MISKRAKHLVNAIRILLLWLITLPLELLTFIVVPIALIGLKSEDKHLPRWARYWQTYDNDINGDAGWAGPEHANGQQNTYLWRLRWLLRNRLGTFSYEVSGFDRGDVFAYYTEGDVMTGNRPGHSGFLYAEAHTINGPKYPCYYWIRQWGDSQRCIRFYAGWKFRQSKPARYWPKEGLAQFVFHFNPFQGFEVGIK